MSGEDLAGWAHPEDLSALPAEIEEDLTEWAVVLYVGPRFE